MAHLAPSGKWDARFVRPCRRVTARPITLLTRCPSGILAPSPTMLATTPSACWVVLLRAVSPTLALRLWTSQNVTCRYVFVLSSPVPVFLVPSFCHQAFSPLVSRLILHRLSVSALLVGIDTGVNGRLVSATAGRVFRNPFHVFTPPSHSTGILPVIFPFTIVKHRRTVLSPFSLRAHCALAFSLARDVSRTFARCFPGNVAASDGSGSQAPGVPLGPAKLETLEQNRR